MTINDNSFSSSKFSSSRQPIQCTSHKADGAFDVIIIGSGISGLTSAAVLSRAGKRVLVLEQHFQVGGFTHAFRRGNYEWDVGIHYIGSIHEKSDWYLQLMALTEGRISFEHFGETTDKIRFPGFSVDMPKLYDDYKQVLGTLFPKEQDGISAYLDKINETRLGLRKYLGSNVLPKSITKFSRRFVLKTEHDAATTTTSDMMSRYIKDEHLKDVLDAQWGNIGMPRDCCSFMVHAAMLGYFLESGAVYPVGGSSVFARELSKTIHDNGSVIRIKAKVEKIIIKNNKAIGVKLDDGEEIFAKTIISSAGANNTYDRFLDGHPAADKETKIIKDLPLAYEYMNLFFGLDCNPEKFGIGKENFWIYRDWNTSKDIFWDLKNTQNQNQPKVIFLNSSSLRDPQFGQHGNEGYNGQIVFIGKQGAFDQWKDTKWRKRGEGYEALKHQTAHSLTDAINRYFPGIKKHITIQEVSTPLSYVTFSGHTRGIPYGIAPTPDRYRSLSLRPQTPIKNLYMTGQDLIMPGLSAAFGSAIMCTSIIMKKNIGASLAKQGRKLMY